MTKETGTPVTFSNDGPSTIWNSVHIPVAGPYLFGSDGDSVATDIVGRLANDVAGGSCAWFFVRYAEQGNHLRFRVSTTPRESSLQRELMHDCLRSYGLAPEVGQPDLTPLSAVALAAQSARASYSWVEYTPEIDRYGGSRAMAIAERVFHASSEISLRSLLTLPRMRRDTRLGLALYAVLATFLTIGADRESVSEMLARYARGIANRLFPVEEACSSWLRLTERYCESESQKLSRQSARIADALDGSGEEDPMSVYTTTLRAAYSELRCLDADGALCFGDAVGRAPRGDTSLARVGFSYAHMTCNRLGVSLGEEARVALVAAHSLRGRRWH